MALRPVIALLALSIAATRALGKQDETVKTAVAEDACTVSGAFKAERTVLAVARKKGGDGVSATEKKVAPVSATVTALQRFGQPSGEGGDTLAEAVTKVKAAEGLRQNKHNEHTQPATPMSATETALAGLSSRANGLLETVLMYTGERSGAVCVTTGSTAKGTYDTPESCRDGKCTEAPPSRSTVNETSTPSAKP
ncbi:hypothetical protein ERJ75_001037100 [Trypanosoma vivax]|nr:hypothetical protein ERJ75_001037100 [Trypanosoma vivax]